MTTPITITPKPTTIPITSTSSTPITETTSEFKSSTRKYHKTGNNSIQETRSYVPTILPKNAAIPSTTTTSTTNANLTPIYPLTTQSTTQ
ncbi:7792_t:CDS:2 [Entrophospora sp. SA101]|nr:7792_t:CDS:2 [Entrophospora sp. SA101]CAJ0894376.1 16884_t:CDS:2 [Entrophospora sp. SA101]